MEPKTKAREARDSHNRAARIPTIAVLPALPCEPMERAALFVEVRREGSFAENERCLRAIPPAVGCGFRANTCTRRPT